MNEFALFYFWVAIMLALYVMSQSSPSTKLLDQRFKNMIKNSYGFHHGVRDNRTGF